MAILRIERAVSAGRAAAQLPRRTPHLVLLSLESRFGIGALVRGDAVTVSVQSVTVMSQRTGAWDPTRGQRRRLDVPSARADIPAGPGGDGQGRPPGQLQGDRDQ